MIIKKMSLPRRTFLRGLGTTLALPLLDAMVPAATALAKTAAKPAPRLGFIYIPNGANMRQWTPARRGWGGADVVENVTTAREGPRPGRHSDRIGPSAS